MSRIFPPAMPSTATRSSSNTSIELTPSVSYLAQHVRREKAEHSMSREGYLALPELCEIHVALAVAAMRWMSDSDKRARMDVCIQSVPQKLVLCGDKHKLEAAE